MKKIPKSVKFNKHHVTGHAFLSGSKYYWVNYSEEKFKTVWSNHQAVIKGIELHKLAEDLIRQRVRLPRNNKTLNMFVNDAIGFRMEPEVVLYYSENSFGTADAICFRDRLLRIHDLKTGKNKASMTQLEIYAALFCLEYSIDPNDIEFELRIYQDSEVIVSNPESDRISYISQKIINFNNLIFEFED